MSGRFAGRTIVITGAGRAGQVGDQLAQTFAKEGASVALLGRNPNEVEARAQSVRALGANAFGLAVDLTDSDMVRDAARQVEDFARDRGGIHAVILAAGGFAMTGPVADTDRGKWDDMLAINLTTAFVTAHAFLPMLRETRGSCVFFASAAALPGATVAKLAAYAAAKSGVVTLMRAIDQDERANGVRANALAPSSIRTPENEKAMGSGAHFVEPAELAAAVSFLCSDEGRAISGQVVALG